MKIQKGRRKMLKSLILLFAITLSLTSGMISIIYVFKRMYLSQ